MAVITSDIQCLGFKMKTDLDEVEDKSVTLKDAMKAATKAVNLYFNNEFEEARRLMEPQADSSMYHALATGVFSFLQAILTFDRNDIDTASKILKKSIEVCDRFRKKSTLTESFSRMLKSADYNAYTEEELHAELCYAECLMVKAVLSFIEDETLVSFLKSGLKMKSCYQSYRECWNILKHRNWANDPNKIHFEGGVRMGVGSFNLFVSLLPTRLLKVLEFVGFTGTKASGLDELLQGYRLKDSLRRILNTMILLAYHLLAVPALGTGESDMEQAAVIIHEQIKIYPNGAWFLFFRGRLDQLQGNIAEAIVWYEKAWKSQSAWSQFHHVCYWELMWSHCFKQDWAAASEFALKLFTQSRWSKSIYAYFRAVFLTMQSDLTEEQQEELQSLMRDIPSWRQRLAGKSLPLEKFVASRSTKFLSQQNRLQLPVLELIYVLNNLPILGKQWTLIEPYYRQVERAIAHVHKEDYPKEDLALAWLLKGCCLRYMSSPLQAEECFTEVIQLEKMVPEQSYIVPCATAELGFLYKSLGKLDEATAWLEAARNNYKGYQLESRLHLRIHAALSDIEAAKHGPAGNGGAAQLEVDFSDLILDSESTDL